MAYPQVSGSRTTQDGSNVTTHSLAFPTGTINSGDLLICLFATDGDNSVTNWDLDYDWTEFLSLSNSSSCFLAAAWRKADGTESSQSFQIETSQSEQSRHIVLAITGADDPDTNPPEGTTQSGDSQTPTPPSHNTGESKDYLWLFPLGVDRDRTISAYPYDDNQIANEGDDSNDCTAAVCSEEKTIAEHTGLASYGLSAIDEWCCFTIAVHPTSGVGDLSKSISESVTPNESISAQLSISGISMVESMVIAENIGFNLPLPVDLSESQSINEALSGDLPLPASISEQMNIAESLSGNMPLPGINISEVMTISEDISPEIPLGIAISDSITILENIGETLPLSKLITQSTTIQELISALSELAGISIAQAMVIVEDITAQLESVGLIEISMEETMTISEALSLNIPIPINIIDSAAISEAIILNLPIAVSTSEITTISELVKGKLGHLPTEILESITIGELIQGKLGHLPLTISEIASITEAIQARLHLPIELLESITINDVIQAKLYIPAEIADALSISELIQVRLNLSPELSESTIINELIQSKINVPVQLSESIAISDIIQAKVGHLPVQVTESITIAELINAKLGHLPISVLESMTITEQISAALEELNLFKSVSEIMSIQETIKILLGDLLPTVTDVLTINELILVSLSGVARARVKGLLLNVY